MNSFDKEKAVEVLLYVSSNIDNMYKTFKIIYFADREHLNRYGRLICGDHYVAMSHGPVPSNLYDMVKEVRGDSTYTFDLDLEKQFKVRRYKIKPLRKANLEYLSKSDIECLDDSVEKYGSMSFSDLQKESHDKAYKSADLNDEIPFKELVKSLPSGEELLEYLTS